MINPYLPQAMGMPVNTMQAMALGMPSAGMMPNALGMPNVPMGQMAPMANPAPQIGAQQMASLAGARPAMAYQPNMPNGAAAFQNQMASQPAAGGLLGALSNPTNMAQISALAKQLQGPANGGAGTVTPSVLPNSTTDLGAQSTQALRNQFLNATGQGGGLSSLSGLLGLLHG